MEELRAVPKKADGTFNPVNKGSALLPAASPTHPPPFLTLMPSPPPTPLPTEAASIMAKVQGLQKNLQMKEQEVLQVSGFISAAKQQIAAMESHQMNLRGAKLLSGGPSKDTLEQAQIDAQVAVDEVNELGDSVLLGAGTKAPTSDDINAFLAENAPDSPQAAAAVGGGYAPAPLPVHAFAPAAAYAPAARAASPPRQLAAPAPAAAQGAAAYDE